MTTDGLTNSQPPLTRYDAVGADELAAIRECLGSLSFAFVDLLGAAPDSTAAAVKLDDLAAAAREVAVLCERHARRLRVVDIAATSAAPDQPL